MLPGHTGAMELDEITFTNSVTVRNLGANPDVAMRWQVDESGDGVAVWGRARVHTDDLD
jgi:hypothetical protein